MTIKNKQLYRQAFFEAKNSKTEGTIIIASSLNQTLYLIAALAVLMAIILFVTFGEYTRKARLQGVVMPSTGIIKIESDADGHVSRLLVKEGDLVMAGQPLYQLDNERYDIQGLGMLTTLAKSINKQYALLETQRHQEMLMTTAKEKGLTNTLLQLSSEIDSARSVLKLSTHQADLSRNALKRHANLINKQYISELAYQQKQIEVAVAEANVESTRQALQRLEREHATTQSELEYLHQQTKIRFSEIDRQLQIIKQQQIELTIKGNTTINAPLSGTVAAILVEPGQAININSPMLTIVPESAKLQVELYSPSRSVGFIKTQQKVGLRFSAFPYQKFGIQYGKVLKISRVSLSANDLTLRGPITVKEREALYRIIIELNKTTVNVYGQEEPLMVGMTVDADVDLDTRRIYEWLAEPLWSLQGKI